MGDLDKALAAGKAGAAELENKMTEVTSGMIDMVKAAQILKTELAAGLSTQGIENFRKELTNVLELLASVNGKVDVTATIRGLSQIKTELDTIIKSSDMFNSTLGYISKTADGVASSIKDVTSAVKNISLDDELSNKLLKINANFKEGEDKAEKFKRAIKMVASETTKEFSPLEKQLEVLAEKFAETGDIALGKEALNFVKKMSDNKVASDDLVKSLEALGKNPLDYSAKLTDMMKELQKEMKAVQDAGDPAKVNELVEKYKELAATKESLEGLEKVIRGVGAALGIALPQLKALEIIMYIAQTIFEWSESSAKVNKQLYDIGANLGHMGEMAGITAGKVSSIAWAFGVTNEAVRDAETGLTKIGVRMKDLEDVTKNQVALSKLWAEYTPQEQTRIMGRYMKEFGMEGKEAQNVMIGIVDLANRLKEIMPKLDIKEFASQIQDVAVSMRKYGLETSDAIALTGVLAKLGIDQARIPELAKAIGGFAMEDPALGHHAMKIYFDVLKKEQTEYGKLVAEAENVKDGKADDATRKSAEVHKQRLAALQEIHASSERIIAQWEKANDVQRTSIINTLEGVHAMRVKFFEMNEFLKIYKTSLATGNVEQLMAAHKVSPKFFPLDLAGIKAFVKARDEMESPLKPLNEGATTEERKAYEEQSKLRELVKKAGGMKGGGLEAIFMQVEKEATKGESEATRIARAEQVARDTTKNKDNVEILKGIIADWARWAMGGDRLDQQIIKRGMQEEGAEKFTKQQWMDKGLSEQSARNQVAIQKAATSEDTLGLKRASLEFASQQERRSNFFSFFAPKRTQAQQELESFGTYTKIHNREIAEGMSQVNEKQKAKEKIAETSKSNIPYSDYFPTYAPQQEPVGHVTIGFDDTTGKLTAGYGAIQRKN